MCVPGSPDADRISNGDRNKDLDKRHDVSLSVFHVHDRVGAPLMSSVSIAAILSNGFGFLGVALPCPDRCWR